MITDIHGQQYTSAEEDLDLIKIKSALQKCVHLEIQRALICHQGTVLGIDLRETLVYFELAYALGRARETDKRKPTQAERKRFEQILDNVLERLGAQVWDAVQITSDQRGELQLGPVIELLDQAYYVGREDGAR